MTVENLFYGFRGSIVFPNQTSIFNMNLGNDSVSKNKLFRSFFNMIQETKKFESHYQRRIYYLIFCNKYDNIFHCKLARKKKFQKRDLVENDIVESKDEDYPYVNILVNLNSQKFLIESNTQVFENHITCKSVIENIINTNLKENDIRIVLESILEEENFWNYFNENEKIYNIEFKLISPNIFDTEDDVNKFLKDSEKNVGSNLVNINFCNPEGNLKPNKTGIDSYIKYICAGGGEWRITRLSSNGRKERISSKQKNPKVNVPISYEEFTKDKLTELQIEEIKKCFNSIEIIEKLKEKI